MVSDSVLLFGIVFVIKKVSDSVSEKFGIEKSIGFGIVQILGVVTHCGNDDDGGNHNDDSVNECIDEDGKNQ